MSTRRGARSTRPSRSRGRTESSGRCSPSRGGRIPSARTSGASGSALVVAFQSGAPCDAEAVADALRLHGDPVEAPINAFFWRNVAGVRAEGDEVLVELHEPSAGMPRLLRSWHSAIHNQAARRAAGEEFGRTTCDGTGPFTFVESVSGSHLDVARWDGYRGPHTTWQANTGPAYLDGVRWIPILDDRERAAALERGEIDCLQNASLLDVDRLAANPDLEVIEFQQSALVYLGLDHLAPELGAGDVRVRRAISHAIDRQALVDRDLEGHGWPASSPIPSHSQWYAPEVESSVRFDPREAAQLLDAAGLEAGPDGVRLALETVVVNDATVRRVVGDDPRDARGRRRPHRAERDRGLRRVLRPAEPASARVHLEVVLARADRRDRRLRRHVGPGRRAELPALERRGPRPRLPRVGGRPRRRGAPRGGARHPAPRCREPAAHPALLRRRRSGRTTAACEAGAQTATISIPCYGDVWLADGN